MYTAKLQLDKGVTGLSTEHISLQRTVLQYHAGTPDESYHSSAEEAIDIISDSSRLAVRQWVDPEQTLGPSRNASLLYKSQHAKLLLIAALSQSRKGQNMTR